MEDALGRVRDFVIVFLKQGTPNIVWSNCKQVFFPFKMVPRIAQLQIVVFFLGGGTSTPITYNL